MNKNRELKRTSTNNDAISAMPKSVCRIFHDVRSYGHCKTQLKK